MSKATCRAQNPLLCREHGLPLDFDAVPAYVTRDVNRLARLYMEHILAEEKLHAAALLEGVLPSEVGWVAYHHPDGAIALRNLVIKSHAARDDFESERQRQAANCLEYVTEKIYELLPQYSVDERFLLTNLVALRFLVAERDWDDPIEGYQETFGMPRTQLFKPCKDLAVREVLQACDRAYVMATTALMPEPETITSLAYERAVRTRHNPTDKDTERALDVLSDALTRHLEDWGVEGGDWSEAEDLD